MKVAWISAVSSVRLEETADIQARGKVCGNYFMSDWNIRKTAGIGGGERTELL